MLKCILNSDDRLIRTKITTYVLSESCSFHCISKKNLSRNEKSETYFCPSILEPIKNLMQVQRLISWRKGQSYCTVIWNELTAPIWYVQLDVVHFWNTVIMGIPTMIIHSVNTVTNNNTVPCSLYAILNRSASTGKDRLIRH